MHPYLSEKLVHPMCFVFRPVHYNTTKSMTVAPFHPAKKNWYLAFFFKLLFANKASTFMLSGTGHVMLLVLIITNKR